MIMLRIQGKGAEGRGRKAQLRRRMLMVDCENAVMTCQMCVDEGQVRNTFIRCFCDLYFLFTDGLTTVTYYICLLVRRMLLLTLGHLYTPLIDYTRPSENLLQSPENGSGQIIFFCDYRKTSGCMS